MTPEDVDALVAGHLRRFYEALEQVCEAALTGGVHGVRVTWEGLAYTIEVHPDVPYGVIHEHRDW